MDTNAATTAVVAVPSGLLDLGAGAAAPSQAIQVGRWPGLNRLAILLGGSAILWAGLGWVAFRVLKLG